MREIAVERGFNARDFSSSVNQHHVAALKSSIAAQGIETPLTCRTGDDGVLLLIDGECRWRAVQQLVREGTTVSKNGKSLLHLPVFIDDSFNATQRIARLIVHNTACPLAEYEKAGVIKRLLDAGWSQHQIARYVGYSQGYVSKLAFLATMPEDILQHFRAGTLSARKIMNYQGDHRAVEAIRASITEKLNGVPARHVKQPSTSAGDAIVEDFARALQDIYWMSRDRDSGPRALEGIALVALRSLNEHGIALPSGEVKKTRLARRKRSGAFLPPPMQQRAHAGGQPSHVLRLNHPDTPTSVLGSAAARFAAAVNHRAEGELRMDVYPNGMLATQRDTLDALVSGFLDFAAYSSSYLTSILPQFLALDMPFLFKDLEACYRVLDGDIGREFFADMEQKGIVGLAWCSAGFKALHTTCKPILAPKDIRGIRVRSQVGAVYGAMYEAVGAIPISIDLNETYTALMQRAVDAVDFSLDVFTAGKFYTVAPHVALSNHAVPVIPLLASRQKLQTLPRKLQDIIHEEAQAVVSSWRADVARLIAEDRRLLERMGIAITEVDHSAFRTAMGGVYKMFSPLIGSDLMARVMAAA